MILVTLLLSPHELAQYYQSHVDESEQLYCPTDELNQPTLS